MIDLLRFPRILILLLLIAFATFVGLLFTPSMPQIGRDFGIPDAQAQWTMSIFLIGYTLGQLPYGPIANRFGRKKAIYIGVVLAFVGSLLAFFSTSFWVLCVARFIQAIGSGVGLKIAFTMVGDIHAGVGATKAISLLTMAFGIMPGIANAIGGFITVLWSWQVCFLFLAFYSILIGLLSLFLPETAKELKPDALKLPKIVHGYGRQFKDSFITLHASLQGLSTTCMYIFATLSPYIAIDRIGLTPDLFGLWSLIPSIGLVTGAILSRNTTHINPRVNMITGILIVLLGTIFIALCFANQWINPWTLFIPMFVMNLGNNLIWSNASSTGLSESKDKSNASAVMQFINVGMATIGVFLIEVVPPTTTMLLPAAFAVILIAMFAIWLKLKAHHRKNIFSRK